jgi:uncharacterized membrane protein YoaK (UPF0700 family)
MFRHRISEPVGVKTYVDWFMLSFLAGNVNTGGYLACHRFVSHVTGFATLAGVDAASTRWGDAIGMLTVPIYFLFGVMVSAYFIDRRVHEGKRPRYALVMGLEMLCLVLAAMGGMLGWFGNFGEVMELRRDYLLLALLCAASGLQNAALTSATGATIRTTHLTGITTDLGIGLIRAASIHETDERRRFEIKANLLRVGTIISFMVGSAIGAVLYLEHGYAGFVLPSVIAGYAILMALRDSAELSKHEAKHGANAGAEHRQHVGDSKQGAKHDAKKHSGQ